MPYWQGSAGVGTSSISASHGGKLIHYLGYYSANTMRRGLSLRSNKGNSNGTRDYPDGNTVTTEAASF